ncbi:MAG: glycosyltransferase [Muribaculaceae bacterium]|nr:glycosyltransferase [Muribaculaceae bacterium]
MQVKLKILHCVYSMTIGGLETMLVDIVNGQVAAGHDVSVLIINDIIDDALVAKINPCVKIIAMRRRQGDRPLLLMAKLNLMILRQGYDIVHIHNHKLCRLIQVRRNRLLFTVHDIDTPMHYASRTNMAAITDAVREDVKRRVPNAKIRTVFNGIRTTDIARREPVTPTVMRIVQVARLDYKKKGQDVLIKAVGTLARSGYDKVEVSFIGGGNDIDYLKNMAQEEGVADRIHFEGERDRDYVYGHLKDFDVMCHPSRYEGFGLTIAEGMAAGLPLVVSEGDGPYEVADSGRLCIGVPSGDVAALATAIMTLKNDWDKAENRATEATGYVKRFDICHTVEAYERYYRDLIRK